MNPPKIHLLIESMCEDGGHRGDGTVGSGGSPAGAPHTSSQAAVAKIEIPMCVSFLRPNSDAPPTLQEAGDPNGDYPFALEPVWVGQQPRLVLIRLKGLTANVNGEPAPPVALLRERDQLQLGDSGYVLHVTRYQRSTLGPPPKELVGKLCPVCCTPFTEETRVYTCACGRTSHWEDNTAPGKPRLQCARLKTHCACTRPVAVSEGYSYVPEGISIE